MLAVDLATMCPGCEQKRCIFTNKVSLTHTQCIGEKKKELCYGTSVTCANLWRNCRGCSRWMAQLARFYQRSKRTTENLRKEHERCRVQSRPKATQQYYSCEIKREIISQMNCQTLKLSCAILKVPMVRACEAVVVERAVFGSDLLS